MQINLRKADALQKSISEALLTTNVPMEIKISEFQDPEVVLTQAFQNFNENYLKRSDLIDVLYAIRQQVANANGKEINNVLNLLAKTEKEIQFYSQLVNVKPQESLRVLRLKLKKIEESTADRYNQEVLTSSFLSESNIKNYTNMLATLKKGKQLLKDSLIEANINTKIALSDSVVNILTMYNLL